MVPELIIYVLYLDGFHELSRRCVEINAWLDRLLLLQQKHLAVVTNKSWGWENKMIRLATCSSGQVLSLMVVKNKVFVSASYPVVLRKVQQRSCTLINQPASTTLCRSPASWMSHSLVYSRYFLWFSHDSARR